MCLININIKFSKTRITILNTKLRSTGRIIEMTIVIINCVIITPYTIISYSH